MDEYEDEYLEAERTSNALLRTMGLMCAVFLSFMALIGAVKRYPLFYTLEHVALVGIAGALMSFLLLSVLSRVAGIEKRSVLSLLTAFVASIASIFWVNGGLDNSTGEVYTLPVKAKYYYPNFSRGCKSLKVYEALVSVPLSAAGQSYSIDIRLPIKGEKLPPRATVWDYKCGLQNQIAGEQLVPEQHNAELTIRDGFLGIPWRGAYRFVKKSEQ